MRQVTCRVREAACCRRRCRHRQIRRRRFLQRCRAVVQRGRWSAANTGHDL